jgi:hypothetical protein
MLAFRRKVFGLAYSFLLIRRHLRQSPAAIDFSRSRREFMNWLSEARSDLSTHFT